MTEEVTDGVDRGTKKQAPGVRVRVPLRTQEVVALPGADQKPGSPGRDSRAAKGRHPSSGAQLLGEVDDARPSRPGPIRRALSPRRRRQEHEPPAVGLYLTGNIDAVTR